MKKGICLIVCVIMSVIMVFSLAACGGKTVESELHQTDNLWRHDSTRLYFRFCEDGSSLYTYDYKGPNYEVFRVGFYEITDTQLKWRWLTSEEWNCHEYTFNGETLQIEGFTKSSKSYEDGFKEAEQIFEHLY